MRELLLAVCCAFTLQATAQKVFIAPTVVQSAEWAKIPYKKTVKKAIKGNRESLKNLVLLYGAIEGKDNALHSRTLLEVLAIVGDSVFSKTLFLDTDRKYYPVLKKHLPAGQQLLEIQSLKLTALSTTFPVSWALLEGNAKPYELMHCTNCKNPTAKQQSMKTDAATGPAPVEDAPNSEHKQAKKQPSQDEIDPKLIRIKPDSTIQIPPDVEKLIDDIIKKQNEQRSQGGG